MPDSSIAEEEREISLIGIRVSYSSSEADLYTLIVSGVEDTPLIKDGELIFFRSPAEAQAAVELVDLDLDVEASALALAYVCDIPEVLYLINQQDRDESAAILNSLNTIFDFLTATGASVPPTYRDLLHKFADHLTFERDFGSYAEGVGRNALTDALLWCIGSIVVKSRIGILPRNGDPGTCSE